MTDRNLMGMYVATEHNEDEIWKQEVATHPRNTYPMMMVVSLVIEFTVCLDSSEIWQCKYSRSTVICSVFNTKYTCTNKIKYVTSSDSFREGRVNLLHFDPTAIHNQMITVTENIT